MDDEPIDYHLTIKDLPSGQATVDGGVGETEPLFVFHELHTILSADGLRKFTDDVKKDLEIVGVVQPGVVGPIQLDQVQEMVDLW